MSFPTNLGVLGTLVLLLIQPLDDGRGQTQDGHQFILLKGLLHLTLHTERNSRCHFQL